MDWCQCSGITDDPARAKFFSIRNLLWVSFIVCTVCLGDKESERGGTRTIIVEKLSLVQNVSNFLNNTF